MKRNQKGFSLVELIIVIAIMAVLIGLLAPQYLKFVSRAKVDTDIQNAVFDRVDEHRITYSIKNITCPVCSFKADETPISIEDILFTAILERAQ